MNHNCVQVLEGGTGAAGWWGTSLFDTSVPKRFLANVRDKSGSYELGALERALGKVEEHRFYVMESDEGR